MPQTQGAGTVMVGGPGTALRGPLYLKGAPHGASRTDVKIFDELGVPQASFSRTFTLQGTSGATAGNYGIAGIVPFACKILTVRERHSALGTDGSAVTVMVTKVPSGTALSGGTACLSAGISLKATVDTNQSGTLHATAANYTFAAGDAWGIALTGTPTAVAGVVIEVEFQRV